MLDSSPSSPECVGPIAIAPELTRQLRALAQAAGVDEFACLWVGATVLVGRLSPRGTVRRARLIHRSREVFTPAPGDRPAPGASFRTALHRTRHGLPTGSDTAAGGPVDVTILLSPDARRLYVENNTDSADAPLAECWARTFRHLLTSLANEPDVPMTEHPLIDHDERDRIVRRLNPYRCPDVDDRGLTAPFEEQVERSPDAVALVDEYGTSVRYHDLNERANRLARFLRSRSAGRGTRVGVCLDRGIDQIVAIYAAVKAGATYVPLDAELPEARLSYMIEDSAPRLVLTDPASRGRIPPGTWEVYDVVTDRGRWAAGDSTNLPVDGGEAALLNILYTSGTTGRPKGVAYPTDGAQAHLRWMQLRYPFQPGDCAVFKTSPGFDVSIWEIFWPLHHGARLVICRPGGHRDPRHLARLVEAHGVTTIFLAPTVMTPFLEQVSADRVGALRWALCAGEPITQRLRDRFYARLPATALVNCYGPTEAGAVTDIVVDPDAGGAVPIGRPAEHFRLTVLDEELGLAPVGMPGEVYISSGTGLAHAYWRAAGRTAERFVADPYGPPGSRMYRTGDLGRYRNDGVLDYLGRIDRQIKVRGMRVEPGEIESVLAAHPAVGDCAVLAHGDPVRLLGFVVPADGETADETAILQHAASVLPVHMRPERVVPVAHIPANINGKVDKDALIRLWDAVRDGEREFVPPADDVEATLVEIYGRLLDTPRVSVLDTFAQLGGHSLLAFQLLDECEQRLRTKPDVTLLLTGRLRDVAASIRVATPAAATPTHMRRGQHGRSDDQRAGTDPGPIEVVAADGGGRVGR